MKVYIQADHKGRPYNINAFSAMLGFEQMGFQTILFSSLSELETVAETNIVVGGVGWVKAFLEQREIRLKDIDYPMQLNMFYGREIWNTTTKELLSQKLEKPIFVKPKLGKQFNGFVYTSERDLIGRITASQNVEVYCSEVLKIEEEWRCFIKYGEILDIKRYAGRLGFCYDFELVKQMVEQYSKSPKGYALDIGVTDQGKTVIIEINDGYSLGSYGLDSLLYAKLLSARWAEITGTEDKCDF